MFNTPSSSVHVSDSIVFENVIVFPGRPRPEVLIDTGSITSTNACETDVFRGCHPIFVLAYNPMRISRAVLLCFSFDLLAWTGPVCRSHCGDQSRDGNGPERSTGGGCHPGTDGFSALDSLDGGYSPLRGHGSKRKRGRGPPLPSRSGVKRQATRIFACPFYLHDRLRHSECLNIRLTRLSDVRQHLLERAHNQVVHCPVCGTTFAGRTAEARRRRDAHVQAETCEPSPSPLDFPGITEDEEQRIREIARNTRTTQYTEVQRWYMIWDFLFPGEQRPDSPFLTDVPDIQRVVDWRNVIFGNDLWLELPTEPWTTAMRLEEQRSGMFNFIDSFIVQARGLVGQNAAPVEDDHGADSSSFIEVDTPDPSGPTANLRVASVASFDSSLPVEASRPRYLSPVSPTLSRQSCHSRALGQADSGTLEMPADSASISFRPLNDPAVEVPQGVTPEEATDISDPTIPSLVFEDFSAEDFILGFPLPWAFSMPGNDDAGPGDAGPDDNHAPPGGGGQLGGRH